MGHVACMEEIRMHTKFWSENPMGRDHFKDLSIDENISECILRDRVERCRLDSSDSADSCEHSTELLGSTKGRECLAEQLLASQEEPCSMELIMLQPNQREALGKLSY
jgi:hypothetical protein